MPLIILIFWKKIHLNKQEIIELIESMMLEKITELQNQLVPFIQNTTQPQNVSVANEFELENKSKRIELLEKTYLKIPSIH